MRHVLIGYELHEDFSKHIGKLVCRHGAKPCNEETGESRKNILDGARLNPKHYDNRQSAAKPEKESSTTIPREGSTIQAIGIGSGFA